MNEGAGRSGLAEGTCWMPADLLDARIGVMLIWALFFFFSLFFFDLSFAPYLGSYQNCSPSPFAPNWSDADVLCVCLGWGWAMSAF
jgi:hypothetical protein